MLPRLSPLFSRAQCLPFRRKVSILAHLRASTRTLGGKTRPTDPGCFGLPGLHDASDWPQIATSCIEDCLAMAERIRQSNNKPSATVLQSFDDLSDRLCRVLDTAELCRNVHPDPAFVEGANEAYLEVSSVIQELNADTSIYAPLCILQDENERRTRLGLNQLFELDSEEAIMLRSLKTDFERGGIMLDAEKKHTLLKLQDEITSASANFTSPSSKPPPTIELPDSKLQNIPLRLRSSLVGPDSQPGRLRVSLTQTNSQLLLKWLPDSAERETVFRLTHCADASKVAALDTLLQSRHEVAVLLGKNSYANLMFDDRLASSPDAVLEFLTLFSSSVHRSAESERHAIAKAKQTLENAFTSDQSSQSVHGWDRSFFIGRLKAENYEISSTDVAQYFPLSACVEALSSIVDNIFGVRLVKQAPAMSELWHPDVEKFELKEEDGTTLGIIFLDLYPRVGKYGHAAHFAIRCGRQPGEENSPYQQPAVALVCNFRRDARSGAHLLSLSEYETLFHEFGHSIHSLLSRTRFQHLSGTRVPTDFVEVPSHIFEHFAWDERVVARFARHHASGEPLPSRTVRALCASRAGFVSTDLQMQATFAAMDLEFHGEHPPISRTTETYEELQERLTVYEPDVGVPVPAHFHHFVGYGAGYYSYIFAKVISAHIWKTLFNDDPFSRKGGMRLRAGLLAYGGAKKPTELLGNVGCAQVSCRPFLDMMGLDTDDPKAELFLPLTRGSLHVRKTNENDS